MDGVLVVLISFMTEPTRLHIQYGTPGEIRLLTSIDNFKIFPFSSLKKPNMR